LTSESCFNIASSLFLPNVTQSMWHYLYFPNAASTKCYQKVCKFPLPINRYNVRHIQSVVTQDIAPVLVLLQPRLPYFLPCIECTAIGLLYPFGNISHREFRVYLVDWSWVSCTS
jgi:hypothetical protein